MRDHFGGLHEVGVAAGVVTVVMRVQHVLDGLVGDATHLLGDELEAVGELVVDDNDAIVGHPDRDVASRLPAVEAGDDVQAVHHFANLQPRFLLRREGGSFLACQHGEPGPEADDRQPAESLPRSRRDHRRCSLKKAIVRSCASAAASSSNRGVVSLWKP